MTKQELTDGLTAIAADLAESLSKPRKNLTEACESGLWVPAYFGNRFKVVRLVGRYKTQQERPTVYRELAEAQAECDRLNGCRTPRE